MNILDLGHQSAKQLVAKRARISAIQGEIAALERAPYALDEARERLSRALNSEFEKQRFNASRILHFRHRGRVDQPSLHDVDTGFWLQALVAGKGDVDVGKRAILESFMALVAADEARSPGMSSREHDKQLAELRKSLATEERAEEAECLRLEEQDRWDVLRRPDVRPEVLLEVWAERD